MRVKATLWGQIRLPPWDPDRLYALFWKHQGFNRHPSELLPPRLPMTPAERSEYAGLLMYAVSIQYTIKRWAYRLPQAGLEPADVAQDLLAHLIRKTSTLKMRRPCPKVLLKCVYDMMRYYVLTRVDAMKTKRREALATDVIRETRQDPNLSDPAPSEFVDVDLGRLLRLAEEGCLNGVNGDVFAAQALYRYQSMCVRRAGETASWMDLPKRLRQRVSAAHHGLVTSRIVRVVEAQAADLN